MKSKQLVLTGKSWGNVEEWKVMLQLNSSVKQEFSSVSIL